MRGPSPGGSAGTVFSSGRERSTSLMPQSSSDSNSLRWCPPAQLNTKKRSTAPLRSGGAWGFERLIKRTLLTGASKRNADESHLVPVACLNFPLQLGGLRMAAKTVRSPDFGEEVSVTVAMENDHSAFSRLALVDRKRGRSAHQNGLSGLNIQHLDHAVRGGQWLHCVLACGHFLSCHGEIEGDVGNDPGLGIEPSGSQHGCRAHGQDESL